MGTQVTGLEERARRLDRLAEEILEGLAPLAFRPAVNDAEREATLRLRHAAVVERGWADGEALQGAMERDEDDDIAVPLVCVNDGEVIGTLRLVFPSPGRPLPTERAFALEVEPPGSAVDAGRVVVSAGHRAGRSHLVVTGLAARGWLEARSRGFQRVVGIASDEAMALYAGLGMTVTPLGPAGEHWGEQRRPIEIAGADNPPSFVGAHEPADDEPAPAGVSRRGLRARAGGVAAGVLLVGVAEAGRPGARRTGSRRRRDRPPLDRVPRPGAADGPGPVGGRLARARAGAVRVAARHRRDARRLDGPRGLGPGGPPADGRGGRAAAEHLRARHRHHGSRRRAGRHPPAPRRAARAWTTRASFAAGTAVATFTLSFVTAWPSTARTGRGRPSGRTSCSAAPGCSPWAGGGTSSAAPRCLEPAGHGAWGADDAGDPAVAVLHERRPGRDRRRRDVGRRTRRGAAVPEPIAIVGIGCRFPGGADEPGRLLAAARRRRDAVAEVPPDRWDADALYDPDPAAPGRINTRWGGFLDDIDQFDAAFFGISPREARRMDPQQRLLLEVAWEALEDARASRPSGLGGQPRPASSSGSRRHDYGDVAARAGPAAT